MDPPSAPGECAVAGCKGRGDLQSFPENEKEKRLWSDFCKREIVDFGIARVCGRHFRDEDYEVVRVPSRRLKSGSLPTQQPPGSEGKEFMKLLFYILQG